jgi:hypothetical protein
MSKNHAMMFEAIQQMEKVWKAEPFQEQGQFWNVGFPQEDPVSRSVTCARGGEMTMAMTDHFGPVAVHSFAGEHGFISARSMPATNSCAVTLPPTRKRWRPLARPTDR